MELSPQQALANDKVGAWLKDEHAPQIFRLFGYAGTGKTTMAMRLAAQSDGQVLFGAFTGKAASVLRKKGCAASTLHSMIYAVQDPDQTLIDKLKERIDNERSESLLNVLKRELRDARKPRFSLRPKETLSDVSLIVVDEVSMVGEQLGTDLCSFGKKILVLGDPGQLPPVEGGGFFTNHEPDVLLTEIHRQARDNPIIAMANMVRQGHRLRRGKYGDSEVVDRRQVASDPRDYDQIICGTNNTRKGGNGQYRLLAGHLNATPEPGEKVICLKNNAQIGILNGTQWRVREAEDKGHVIAMSIENWDEPPLPPEAEGKLVECHHFDTDYNELEWYERAQADEFDFGYYITCHKSQGSQWDNILVQDQSWIFKENAARWLYTAITRAATKLRVSM